MVIYPLSRDQQRMRTPWISETISTQLVRKSPLPSQSVFPLNCLSITTSVGAHTARRRRRRCVKLSWRRSQDVEPAYQDELEEGGLGVQGLPGLCGDWGLLEIRLLNDICEGSMATRPGLDFSLRPVQINQGAAVFCEDSSVVELRLIGMRFRKCLQIQ